MALFLATTAFGIGQVEKGNRLYRDGRYAEAVAAYQAALEDGDDSPVLRFNLGTALLRLGRYAEAEPHLRAALDAVDTEVREPALFNLGNRFLEEGRAAADPQARQRLLDAAAEAYRRALRLDPSSGDAKWNYELALQEQQQSQRRGDGSREQQQPDRQDQEDQGTGGEQSQERQSAQQPQTGAMTREQAERLLAAVEQNERDLVRDKLRKGRRETQVARDW
jgi:Ca-activated chloride channel family protein